MADKDTRSPIKLSQEVYVLLKEEQYRAWKATGRQPSYNEIISEALGVYLGRQQDGTPAKKHRSDNKTGESKGTGLTYSSENGADDEGFGQLVLEILRGAVPITAELLRRIIRDFYECHVAQQLHNQADSVSTVGELPEDLEREITKLEESEMVRGETGGRDHSPTRKRRPG